MHLRIVFDENPPAIAAHTKIYLVDGETEKDISRLFSSITVAMTDLGCPPVVTLDSPYVQADVRARPSEATRALFAEVARAFAEEDAGA